MKNVTVKIEAKTSQVFLNKKTLGINGENLQGDIIFEFTDEFVNGVAWLEVQMPNGEKGYLECNKNDNTYVLPILSSLLKEVGNIEMQLRITENRIDEIPVFKSNKFYLEVKEAINATTTIPEEYPSWIDTANSKINEIDVAIEQSNIATNYAVEKGQYAEEQGNFAKEQSESVQQDISDIRITAERAEDKSDTAISIAKGANQALDYLDYANMIANFNAFEKNKFNTSQQIMIKKLNVPDVWIYQLTEQYQYYTYTTDEEVIDLLLSDNGFHVGYYVLSALETQKVDLTNYVTFNDRPTTTKAGVIKMGYSNSGIALDSSGYLKLNKATNSEIDAKTALSVPIVPANLDYAVGSVKASETQFGTIKAWISENEDGEIGLNISTEV